MKQKRKYTNTKPMELPDKYRQGFLEDLDKRTLIYQSLQASYDAIMADVGGKGSLSHVQCCLVERFCFLEFVLRGIEVQIAEEKPKDIGPLVSRWVQALNSLVGLGKTIGLQRRAKKVNLHDYVESKRRNR